MSQQISQAELQNQCRHPKLKRREDSSDYEGEKGAYKCRICGMII